MIPSRWRAAFARVHSFTKPVLIGLVVLNLLGIAAWCFRLSKDNPILLGFLALAITLIALLRDLFKIEHPLDWHSYWQRLNERRWWKTVLWVLTVGLWVAYVVLPGAANPGASETDRTPYTLSGVCASTSDITSDRALRESLSAEVEQQAINHFGGNQSVRPIGLPEFYNGASLGEVCVRATFEVIGMNE